MCNGSMRETIHRMALWNFSFLGLAVLIGSVTCQAPNQERVGVVFSLGYYPNFLAVVEGQPTQLDGKTIAFDKYLKFNDSNTFAVSMVVDTQNESLYYFDSHLKSIFRINNFNLDLDVSRVTYDVIRDGISDSAVQIAFDWISRNIYWTDDYNDWIAVQPVFTRDRSLTKHVIDKMLQTPLALAIDPESGYLFFSDLKPAPRIEVCNLLGEKRRALVTSGLSYPSHIAVDHKEGRIFWVDSESGALESILYNGINRTLHAAGVAYFASSLHYFKGHICASFDYMYLVGCSPVNGFNEELFGFVKYAPITTTVYDPESQTTSITNRCNAKKCQHFCINTPTAARCVCKEGYQLNRDGVNCTAGHILSKKGILFTNGSNLCVLDIVAINSNKSRPNCVVNKLGYIHYLQADSNKGIVYHWNKNIRSIQKYNLVTGRLYNLTFTNDVKGLFYDWVNEELYWSESDQYGFRIRLFDLVTESESKYQYEEDTKSFEYLTGNPYNDILFWVLKENRYAYMIEMGTMKGSNRTIVMNSDSLTKPTALAYDSVYNRLYWIDSGEITSVKITTNIGQTKIIYHDYTGPTAHTLYLYKDYALWIYNNNIKAVVVEENDDYVYESTVLTVMNGSDVTCMTYFDQRTQTKTRAPCKGDNGGCQYLCIPTTNGPLCTCPFGYKVSKDGKSCRSDLLTNNFALIVDYDSKMYQIPLNKTITEDDIVAVNITEKRKGYISDIIYDATNGFVYWLIDGLELCRSKLNGENFTIITTIAEDYVENFEVDQTTGNIYIMPVLLYGHEVSGHISVLRQMASNEWKQTKIIEDLKDYFVIHPKKGYIFWLDSYQYMFGRTNMDGTNSMVLKKHTYEVWRFYIDYSGDRLYWSDDYYGGVYSMDTNGNDLKKFLAAPDGINAIAFQDNTVFIVMSHGSKIYRYDKTSGKEVKWMKNITYIQGIDYIAIVPGNKQPENDMCKNNNGDCSTFCLPTSSGRTCACEDGVKLRSDKKTCGNVCDSFLQNGQITDCVIKAGAVCSYKCNSLYEKNTSIDKLRCFRNMTWDHKLEDLCKEKRCTMNIPNVNFLNHCEGKMGSVCLFECKNGYVKNEYNLPSIVCSAISDTVQWNTDINKLCKRAISCPVQIPHGGLYNCPQPTAGTICGIICDNGYTPLSTSQFITCGSDGNWNEQLDQICKEQISCPVQIPHGSLINCPQPTAGTTCGIVCDKIYTPLSTSRFITCGSDGNWNKKLDQICKDEKKCPNGTKNVQLSSACPRTPLSKCSYSCTDGKFPAFPNVKNVTCLQGNQWIPALDILCTDFGANISATGFSRKQQQTSDNSGVIGGILGTIIIILVICLVVGIICFIRRTRKTPDYNEGPNVFFRNPSVTENPYDQFSNVECGQITSTQFSNPMSNIDSIYDNIPDRQGAEGTSAGHQGMKAVEEKTMDTSYNKEDTDNKVNKELKKEAETEASMA